MLRRQWHKLEKTNEKLLEYRQHGSFFNSLVIDFKSAPKIRLLYSGDKSENLNLLSKIIDYCRESGLILAHDLHKKSLVLHARNAQDMRFFLHQIDQYQSLEDESINHMDCIQAFITEGYGRQTKEAPTSSSSLAIFDRLNRQQRRYTSIDEAIEDFLNTHKNLEAIPPTLLDEDPVLNLKGMRDELEGIEELEASDEENDYPTADNYNEDEALERALRATSTGLPTRGRLS